MTALGIILSLQITPYLYGVTSVTWVVMGTCGPACGVHDNRRHHVFRLGSLIGLRSMARFGWHDVCNQDGKVWELNNRF